MSTEPRRADQVHDWRKDQELWAAYEKIKSELTEEEKRDFTMDEPLIPFDQVVAELEELQRRLKCKEATG